MNRHYQKVITLGGILMLTTHLSAQQKRDSLKEKSLEELEIITRVSLRAEHEQ